MSKPSYNDALGMTAGFAAAAEVKYAADELKAASVISDDAAAFDGTPDDAQIKEALVALAEAALTCIDNAALPYDTAKLIARGLASLTGIEAAADIKKAAADMCGLEYAPELVHMIATHYQNIQSGISDEQRTRVAVLKNAYNKGYCYEKNYKGCAQCTLAAMFDIMGKKEPMVFQAASGLSGGMALSGDGACGGYSGGILFTGTLDGRRLEYFDNDEEAKRQSYKTSQMLHDKMIDVYGSIRCKDIHTAIFGRSYLIRDSEDSKKFEQAGAHKSKCTNVVGYVSMLIAGILMDEGYL